MTPEELETWLDARPVATRAQEAAWIASRAAARVLPVLLRLYGESDEADLTALNSCRCILTSGILGVKPTSEIKLAANAASGAPASDNLLLNASHATSAAFASVTVGAPVSYSAAVAARAAAAFDKERAFADAALSADIASFEKPHQRGTPLPLWPTFIPDRISEKWEISRIRLAKDATADWKFWIDWYDGLLEGTPQNHDMLTEIVLIPDADWAKGPAHVNAIIAEIVRAAQLGTPLARAHPVDFSFDSLLQVMRLVGIDDDTAHLRDPVFVQRFQDDCEELRDTLQNFTDYAQALTGGGNFAGILRLAADKVLRELTRIEDSRHVRARYLVTLGNELDAFSKEQRARDDLGDTLAGILDNSLKLLRTVTRQHFAPSYTALAPLGELTLEHIDQGEVIALLDTMIDRLQALPDDQLVALDQDGLSVLRDMVRETKDTRAAIAEASSDAFRAMLENRLAESLGGTGLALSRFLEMSSQATGTVSRSAERAIGAYKKVQSLKDIFDALKEFLAAGAPG